jgi:predicted RNA-binding protein YlxR (DUF448 family)
MVRLCLQDGRVAIAARGEVWGRGASIHPRPVCIVAALKPGVLARAFKRPVVAAQLDAAALGAELTETSRNRKLGTP